tara:strand:- start:70 stop:276 length:207 start_codon:yes stop_codon:yes gene_type:complete
MEGTWDRQEPERRKVWTYVVAFFVLVYLGAVYQGCSAIKSLPSDKPIDLPSQQEALELIPGDLKVLRR